MKKKSILISAGAALALSGAQFYLLGAKGGVGPMGFLRERKLASLPGNGEVYSFDRISPLENSPLAEKDPLRRHEYQSLRQDIFYS